MKKPNGEPAVLDAIDRRILAELQADGRMTNVELARRAGISAPPCLRRVRRLEEAGIIRGYHADPDPQKLGWEITVFAVVGLDSQKEAVLSARRVLVTVEEVVATIEPRPGGVVLPSWTIDYVSVVPNGAHPSYSDGYTQRDNDFYVAWDAISRDRDSFRSWMEDNVLSA